MEKKSKILKIINIVPMVFTMICAFGAIFTGVNRKMDLNNPIIPDNLVNNMLFQDMLKAVIIFGVFYFQLKLYKRISNINSTLFFRGIYL